MKTDLEQNRSKERYLSPKVLVYLTSIEEIICASGYTEVWIEEDLSEL